MKQKTPPVNYRAQTYQETPTSVFHAIDDYVGDDSEYWEAFVRFLDNRMALHKPIRTAKGINVIINRLRAVNDREKEIAMLDMATARNWLTVYPRG